MYGTTGTVRTTMVITAYQQSACLHCGAAPQTGPCGSLSAKFGDEHTKNEKVKTDVSDDARPENALD